MLDEDSITAEYSLVNMFLSFYDKLYMIIIKSSSLQLEKKRLMFNFLS